METEEEHRSSFCRGRAGHPGGPLLYGERQQEIFQHWRMGLRAVRLRSGIRHLHGRQSGYPQLRGRVPCESESEGLRLPSLPESMKPTSGHLDLIGIGVVNEQHRSRAEEL